MVSLTSLWVPILLSAVIVFVASTIIHMLLTYHRRDFARLPQEDKIMEALRPFDIPPDDYVMPCAEDPSQMKSPEFNEKLNKGPVAFMTVLPNGPIAMGSNLAQWFVFLVIVGIFSAYLAGRTLGPGTGYLAVFRVVGCASFLAYGVGLVPNSIWYARKWGSTLKSILDGLIYALLTAGTFGWLWPA